MRKQINKPSKQAAVKDARDYGIEANFFPADILHLPARWNTAAEADYIRRNYLPKDTRDMGIIYSPDNGANGHMIFIIGILPPDPTLADDDRFVTYGLLQALMRDHQENMEPVGLRVDPMTIFPYQQAVQNGRV